MKFLLPKAPAFAEHFEEMSVCLAEIADVFHTFSVEFRDFEKYWQKSKEIEHRADDITHGIINLINKSFITPFDREDIYRLIHEYDDIIDLLENTLHNVYLYEVTEKRPFIDEFARLIGRATAALIALVKETFDKQKYTDEIWKEIREIHDLEDEGDGSTTDLRQLFKEEKDLIEPDEVKDILITLERPRRLPVAWSNTVEGIVVEAADSMESSFGFIALIIAIALIFDFTNGPHDAANGRDDRPNAGAQPKCRHLGRVLQFRGLIFGTAVVAPSEPA